MPVLFLFDIFYYRSFRPTPCSFYHLMYPPTSGSTTDERHGRPIYTRSGQPEYHHLQQQYAPHATPNHAAAAGAAVNGGGGAVAGNTGTNGVLNGGSGIAIPGTALRSYGSGGGSVVGGLYAPQPFDGNPDRVTSGFNTLLTGFDKPGGFAGRQWFRMMVAEFFVTLFFFFTVQLTEATGAPLGAAALASGFLLAALLNGFVYESGSHIFSVLTFALFLIGQTDFVQLLVYTLLVHPAAHLVATLLVWLLAPASSGLGAPVIGAGFSVADAFGFEVVGTTILVFTFYMLFIWRPRAAPTGLLAYLAPNQCYDGRGRLALTNALLLANHTRCCPAQMFGLAFGALSLAGSLVSGASFDWYRHLWPAIFSPTVFLSETWVYLVGPFVGALIARILLWMHRLIFLYDTGKILAMYRASEEVRASMESNAGRGDLQPQQEQQQQQQQNAPKNIWVTTRFVDPLATTSEDMQPLFMNNHDDNNKHLRKR